MSPIIILAVWWLIGVLGFIFWWTRQNDFTTNEIPVMALFGGGLGPIAWFAGWLIHGGIRRPTVLIKAQK